MHGLSGIARRAALLAALASLLVASPTAGVDAADYLVWRFPAPGARGLGLMHARASDTTLLAETVGLQANSQYRLVGSAAPCSDAHRAADLVWARSFQSNGRGAALVDATLAEGAVGMVRSVRLFHGASQSDCAKPVPYDSGGGGTQPTDAFARLNAFGARLLVFVDLGSPSDRLTAVGHGFIASHGYRLVAADVACPTQPNGAVLFQKTGSTNSLGILWRYDTGTNLTGKPPRSVQLFNPSDERVACANTRFLRPVQ